MAINIKRLRSSFAIMMLLALVACDLIPLDFIPKPPTPIPGPASLTPIPVLATATAPGFPTLIATETRTALPETETLVPTVAPTETRGPSVTLTPLPPTSTPRPEPFFALQPGGPQPLVNIARPESGCNWMGVGGQVFDRQGIPMVNYLIQLEGELMNENISVLALTGGAPQLGPGGYLLEVASQPIETSGMLYMQVLDLSGRVLSDKIFITTYAACDKNLILVNFTQLPPDMNNFIFLPGINK